MSSITHVVDGENEEILNRYEYDAWGNLTTCEEKVQNRFKFNGQQYDPVSQQYYLRARYYNPVIGRFTQEDSYNVDGLNLYAYCRNNPIYYVDPSGNICGRRANTLMDNVLSGGQLTRKEKRQLAARLRDEARNGTISDKGRDVARQMGIDVDGIEAGIKNQGQSRQNATEENSNKSSSNTSVPDSTQFPQTRLDIHNDLISRGYYSTGTTDQGYVVYKDGKGHIV
ncbi:MAG: RHS repeat-associated core domain-containing protein, partial [Lachnospiraceae bacterium]|nr:RHS repeat-associated core domain-containing protein [Lachnospiraceae bacterium]